MQILITRGEAAASLRVCTKTVDRQILERGLPARKIGDRALIPLADFEAWVRQPPDVVAICTTRRYQVLLSATDISD